MNNNTRLNTLVQAVRDHAEFEHHVDRFDLIETHISCILLTGPYAYKFKKPVNLGFLDFSTLEKRRFYCYEEIRLNRRLAPALYLEVVPITGSEEYPEIGGAGPVLEYAVKMVQFPAGAELDQVLKAGYVTKSHMEQLADQIAAFHSALPRSGEENLHGSPETIRQAVFDNFTRIRSCLGQDPDYLQKLSVLEQWTTGQYELLAEVLAGRKRNGYIRECHGDMHLGNIILHEGKLLIFDCIEFSENLRWIDVISEVAFLFMDLESRRQAAFAFRFLNKYLECTGDYPGLSLLRFYCVYRALVRAKVACLALGNSLLDDKGRQQQVDRYRHYMDYALNTSHQQDTRRYLIITHGLSGSGKSTVAQSICEYLSAIRLRSDVERKRLCRLEPGARTGSGVQEGIYTDLISQQTYATLGGYAEKILRAGHPVIVDGTFLQKKYRQAMRELARRLEAPFIILDVEAGRKTLRRRVLGREAQQADVSEATTAVLDHQIASRQPLDDSELQHRVLINTEVELNYLRIADDINTKVQQLEQGRTPPVDSGE